jgi:hypothetical protein
VTVAAGVPAAAGAVATNPKEALAPGARVPFHAAFLTVAVPSAAVERLPFHSWVRRAPFAGTTVAVQPRTAEADEFVTVTSP